MGRRQRKALVCAQGAVALLAFAVVVFGCLFFVHDPSVVAPQAPTTLTSHERP